MGGVCRGGLYNDTLSPGPTAPPFGIMDPIVADVISNFTSDAAKQVGVAQRGVAICCCWPEGGDETDPTIPRISPGRAV